MSDLPIPQWLKEHKAEMLKHYTNLIQLPGWQEYTTERLAELEKGTCKGITKRIKADIAETALHGLQNLKEK